MSQPDPSTNFGKRPGPCTLGPMAAPESRYQKMRAIASGGMATVYLGRTVGPGGFERLVAIKVMHAHIAENEDFVAMFLDEARLAAQIRHPNVVATFDVGEDALSVFLVMEYVEGASVGKLVRRRGRGGRLPIPVTLRIVSDVLAGLHAAHELHGPDGAPLNLVHRDVSPHNILVGVDGVARITDFGIARAESRLAARTATGQVKGKYAYMSYEALHAQPVDRRSDVYSAGIVLWELLAGQRLFRGENDGAVALAAGRGATQWPREFNPEVPPQIDAVVARALSPSPEQRFPTAAAFAEALEDAANAAGIRIAKPRDVADVVAGTEPPDDVPTVARSVSSVVAGPSDTPPAADTPFSVVALAAPPQASAARPPSVTPASGPLPSSLSAVVSNKPSETDDETEIGGPNFGKEGTIVIPPDWGASDRTIEMPTEPLRKHAEIVSLVIPPLRTRTAPGVVASSFDEPAPPIYGRYSRSTLALTVGVTVLVVAATISVLTRSSDPAPAAAVSIPSEPPPAPAPEVRPAPTATATATVPPPAIASSSPAPPVEAPVAAPPRTQPRPGTRSGGTAPRPGGGGIMRKSPF